MKRPAFQFYPADWRKDPCLSVCSLAARGLWIELMCIAHESAEYGVLSINGKAMTDQQIARSVGESVATVAKLLAELEQAGVFSRDDQGAIFSRRMRKDEHIREVRAQAGRLGGNPNLLNQTDKQTGKQSPTPSSSSSSSTSEPPVATATGGRAQRGTRLPADFQLPKTWGDWALQERPDWTADDVRRVALAFRNHWVAKTRDATKLDWLATWQNWVLKEPKPRAGAAPRNRQADLEARNRAAGEEWLRTSGAPDDAASPA